MSSSRREEEREGRLNAPSQHENEHENNLTHQRRDSITFQTTGANARTPPTAQHPPRASSLSPRAPENSSASSGEDTADDSFASVITVVPLQRVGRSLWQPPGSPGAAVDPPRASTDSFRSNRRSGLRPRQQSDASDPFVDSRSRAGTAGTTGSSTPLLGVVPVRPERAHTVQRGREQRRDLSGGRQSIETTPGEGRDIIRSLTHTASTNSTFRQTSTSTSNNSNVFGSSLAGPSTNPTTTTTTLGSNLTSAFDNTNINLSSPLRARTDSTIAMKDGKPGPSDLNSLTPGSKDKSVLGSIKRGINNLGSIRGHKTPKTDDDDSAPVSERGRTGGTSGGVIKKKKSLSDLLGSIKKATTPRPRAQAAFELQPFPCEQSMIGGLLLHGPQRLELARGGDGRYAARDKNGPVFPPRLPLEPRTEVRRGDPNNGCFLSPAPAYSRDGRPGGEAPGSAARSPRPDRYADKPLPPLPSKTGDGGKDGGDYEECRKGGKGKGKRR